MERIQTNLVNKSFIIIKKSIGELNEIVEKEFKETSSWSKEKVEKVKKRVEKVYKKLSQLKFK